MQESVGHKGTPPPYRIELERGGGKMGRSILEVNIGDILGLAWDHPLITGGLALMLTTPVFRVVIYFYPLLISTALCALALVSAGQQIEAARKREIAGWNAKIVDEDHLSARLGVSSTIRQTRVPAGQDNWLNGVHNFQLVGSALNKEQIDGTFMNDFIKENDNTMKEERLQRVPDEFRFVNEGPAIEFLDEEVLDRQIEAFHEYERSLSSKRKPKARASPSFTEGVIPFSPEEFNNSIADDWSASKEIPPMVLHSLRTGGTGRRADDAKINSGGSGATFSSYPFIQDVSNKDTSSDDDDYPPTAPPMVFHNLRTGGTGRRDDNAKAYGEGGAPNERKNSMSHEVSTPKTIPPMVFHTLRTGGTDRGADAKVNNGGTGGAPAGSSKKEAIAELGLSSGRFDSSGSNLLKNVDSSSPIIKPEHWLENEKLVGDFTARGFQGNGESPVIGSEYNVASSASEKRPEKRAPTYTSPLRAFRGEERSSVTVSNTGNVTSPAWEKRPEKRAPIYTSPLRAFRGKEEKSPVTVSNTSNVTSPAWEKRPEKRAPIYTSPLRAFRGKEEKSPVTVSNTSNVASPAWEKRPEKRAPIYTSPLRAFRGKEEKSPVTVSNTSNVASPAWEKRPEKRAPIYTSPLRAFRGKEEKSPVTVSNTSNVTSPAWEKRPEKRAPIYTSPLRAFRGKEEKSPVTVSNTSNVASPAWEKRPEKRVPICSSPLRVFRGKEESSPVTVSNTSNVVSSSPARSRPEERGSSSLRRASPYSSASRYTA